MLRVEFEFSLKKKPEPAIDPKQEENLARLASLPPLKWPEEPEPNKVVTKSKMIKLDGLGAWWRKKREQVARQPAKPGQVAIAGEVAKDWVDTETRAAGVAALQESKAPVPVPSVAKAPKPKKASKGNFWDRLKVRAAMPRRGPGANSKLLYVLPKARPDYLAGTSAGASRALEAPMLRPTPRVMPRPVTLASLSPWSRSKVRRAKVEPEVEVVAPWEDEAGVKRERRKHQEIEARLVLKAELHEHILEAMAAPTGGSMEEVKIRVLAIVEAELEMRQAPLRRGNEREELIESLLNDVFGLGPIQKLVDDPEVTEIMVNGPDEVFEERNGRIYLTNIKFDSEAQEMSVIERIVGMVGRRVDESFPMADARLPDGSRVNVILPPLSLHGPCLTIRKFREEHYTAEQLVEMGSANSHILDFLRAAVKGKANILIAGGTSSGKTTLLNVLSGFIADSERIVTIEDAAELRLNQRHVVPLETRPPNSDGKGTIVIRDLVRNALRMRPDRIIVGEVRGPEALDMIQAMNTGHDGSMSTLHANSSGDALQRLEAMAMMAGIELPSESIRFQICSAIELVVHTERVSGGARKIIDVSEVLRNRGEMTTRTIFHYLQTGVDDKGDAVGVHDATGVIPECLSRIRERGGTVEDAIFSMVAEARRSPDRRQVRG